MNLSNSNHNVAVVLGLSPTGLSVARSLAPHGVRVYGVDSLRYEIGHFSCWIKHDKRISYQHPGAELLEGLIEFGKEQHAKPVIFIAGDPYIDFVAQNRKALTPYFIMPESMCEEVNSVLLHKQTFYAHCSDLGIVVPVTFFPKTEEEAVHASEKLSYPCIVKPALGHMLRKKLNGQKLVKVNNANDLLKWWCRLRDWGDISLLQEVIEGPEANIAVAAMYMDSQLQCRSLFTAVKNRQYPPMYGSGSYMESKWLPEIADLSIHAARRLRYKGVCGTEFKLDERDNVWKLVEINCRPTLWFALTRRAGVDVVWDAYCDLVGRPNPISIGKQDNSVRWQLLVRDIVSAQHLLRKGEISMKEFFHTVVSPVKKEYAILSLRDVRASLAYPLDMFVKYWTHYVKTDRN